MRHLNRILRPLGVMLAPAVYSSPQALEEATNIVEQDHARRYVNAGQGRPTNTVRWLRDVAAITPRPRR